MQPVILLAEDDDDIRSLVCHALEADGYAVYAARDGQEALEYYREIDPDLVILDLTMPRLSGFEVLRELQRTGERRPGVPIMVLSARSGEEDVVAGFDLGIDDYVTKPFMIRELRARVRAMLARRDVDDVPPKDVGRSEG